MSQELEIEFKNMLTETEYHALLKLFGATKTDFFTQENFYYDTPTGLLKQLHCGLRIRILPLKAEQTLKTPLGQHLLETTDSLSQEEAEQLKQKDTIKQNGEVGKKLTELAVPMEELHCFGSLKTIRFEKTVDEGLLVLDKSNYAGKEDYELEFEAQSHKKGKSFFNQFLQKNDIPIRKGKNKIQRMSDALQK